MFFLLAQNKYWSKFRVCYNIFKIGLLSEGTVGLMQKQHHKLWGHFRDICTVSHWKQREASFFLVCCWTVDIARFLNIKPLLHCYIQIMHSMICSWFKMCLSGRGHGNVKHQGCCSFNIWSFLGFISFIWWKWKSSGIKGWISALSLTDIQRFGHWKFVWFPRWGNTSLY